MNFQEIQSLMKATYNELDVLFLIPCNSHRVSILPGISLRGRGTHAILTSANNCDYNYYSAFDL